MMSMPDAMKGIGREEEQQQQVVVIILASPGMGHLIPITELARRLVLDHQGLSVTIVTASTQESPTATISLPSPSPISHIPLPPVPTHHFPRDSKMETRISLTVKSSLPHLRRIFEKLSAGGSTRIAALVVDLFGSDAYDVAADFGVPSYMFMTSTFALVSLCLHLAALDSPTFSYRQYRDLPHPVRAPGCLPLRGDDLPNPFQDRSDDSCGWVLHHFRRHNLMAKGILGNSFLELEPRVIKTLLQLHHQQQEEDADDNGHDHHPLPLPPPPIIYPVGPLVRSPNSSMSMSIDEDQLCLRWLDEQPRGSVLFVCFGSGGTLCREQLRELAWGLEMSGQRFLWVARAPDEKEACGKYFSVVGGGGEEDQGLHFLSDGFLERTKGRGLVLVGSWAPQLQVLSHESTGGFLSHCGWNSTLESILQGVPIIAWPLYAEQKMNAVMLVDDLKVALPLISSSSSSSSSSTTTNMNNNMMIVRREEIAKVVSCLMQGEDEQGKSVRKRMGELRDAAHRALEKDGGSSHTALAQVVCMWKPANVPID